MWSSGRQALLQDKFGKSDPLDGEQLPDIADGDSVATGHPMDRKAALAKIFQNIGFDRMQASRAYAAGAWLAGFAAGARRPLFVVVHNPLHLPYFAGLGVSQGPQKRFKFREQAAAR